MNRSLLPFLPRLAVTAAFSLLGLSPLANASTINVVNGNFEQTQTNQSYQLNYGSTPVQTLTGWTNSVSQGGAPGYSFVYLPGTAATTGAYTPQFSGNVALWGKNLDGTSNGLGSSPAGGNFVGMDGAFEQGLLYQTLSGLTPGALTTVSFYYAGAQQAGFDGPTSEAFWVFLGNDLSNASNWQETAILNDASHGFTGWQGASLTFTATSTSETLGFLAAGTPNGEPPFTLLDGVSVHDNVAVTPEPGTFALLGTGVLTVGGLLRRRFLAS